MKAVSLATLAKVCGGFVQGDADISLSNVVLDSRAATASSLFVALPGDNVDGHNFVASLEGKAAAALVSKEQATNLAQIIVKDTEQALVKLATFARKQFTGKVVGITGSSGKTSCKNLLANILQQAGNVYKSQGNQNNELGVPLTLLNAGGDEDYIVVEMGAAKVGDIAYLMAMVNPDISVVTNIAEAHLGRFGSLENIVKTKSEIYQLAPNAKAVVNADEPYASAWQQQLKGREIIRFGFANNALEVYASDVQLKSEGSQFTLHIGQDALACKLATSGKHQVMNALCAAALAHGLNVSGEHIVTGLGAYQNAAGRGRELTTLWGSKIIDDCYNANPASVKAAIDRLMLEPTNKCLVLGDMAELGEQSKVLHQQIGDYAKTKGLQQLWTVGNDSQCASKAFAGQHFNSMDAIAEKLLAEKPKTTLLIKGSRSAGLEYLIKKLTTKESH